MKDEIKMIQKFRKKPVEIEAIQWNGNSNKQEIDSFVGRTLNTELESETAYLAGQGKPIFSLLIETKEGISTKGVTVDFPLLEEIAAKIHKGLQYKGASNIQFIVENGIPYFIEMNPRFSGAGILSYHAGLNSPLFTAYESVQSPLFNEAKNTEVKKGVFMTRYWNENFYEG